MLEIAKKYLKFMDRLTFFQFKCRNYFDYFISKFTKMD